MIDLELLQTDSNLGNPGEHGEPQGNRACDCHVQTHLSSYSRTKTASSRCTFLDSPLF